MSVIGLDCKLYYNSGTYASPTWVEITAARDVKKGMKVGTAEIKSRASAFTKYHPAHIDLSISFDVIYNRGDAATAALLTACLGRTNLEFAVMDGSITASGSKGWRMECIVSGFDETQPLVEGARYEIEALPSATASHDPAQYTVA